VIRESRGPVFNAPGQRLAVRIHQQGLRDCLGWGMGRALPEHRQDVGFLGPEGLQRLGGTGLGGPDVSPPGRLRDVSVQLPVRAVGPLARTVRLRACRCGLGQQHWRQSVLGVAKHRQLRPWQCRTRTTSPGRGPYVQLSGDTGLPDIRNLSQGLATDGPVLEEQRQATARR